MKNQLLATTAIVLFVSFSAIAATTATSPTAGQRLDQGIAATEKAAVDVVEKVRDMMGEKDTAGAYGTVAINTKTSALGMIGQNVFNANNEEISKVEDVLINQYGNAAQIILTNGGFLGIGAKLVAVDFGLVYMRSGNSDVIMPITDDTIKNMAPFAYDITDSKDGTRTIPSGYLSAKAMLAGHLFDTHGTQVGTIDNVSFIGGKATQVVIGYNATMGMGGNKLAASYDLLQKMGHGSIVDFKLSDAQTARFEVYSKATN